MRLFLIAIFSLSVTHPADAFEPEFDRDLPPISAEYIEYTEQCDEFRLEEFTLETSSTLANVRCYDDLASTYTNRVNRVALGRLIEGSGVRNSEAVFFRLGWGDSPDAIISTDLERETNSFLFKYFDELEAKCAERYQDSRQNPPDCFSHGRYAKPEDVGIAISRGTDFRVFIVRDFTGAAERSMRAADTERVLRILGASK